MATGVGTGFDFSGLNKACKEVDKKIGDIIRKGNTLEQSLTKNFQNITNNGVEPLIKKLQQINTSLGGTNKIVDMINRIVSAFGKLKTTQNVKMNTSSSESSIKKLQKEIEKLQKQQNKTAAEVAKWKGKYDKLANSVKNVSEHQGNLVESTRRLNHWVRTAFSIHTIKNYMNKLIQVRGEFAMQQKSLEVLLQNKAEADALWEKTVSLAVRSPFTTKQLITNTKQLAAYRIEHEKLYETNKMLADVSAGLGVDMNRLILAYGQVKAANFLRGTELRQFTEAGVNMLGELSLHFEKLEGRAVSVAEVFERISKRQVTFEDVDAVFKNITSKGGTFYKMQEKQSLTLKGMIANLRDSYELMLNDIGQKSEGVLVRAVAFMKKLVDNWEEVWNAIQPLLNALIAKLLIVGGTKVVRGIMTLFSAFRTLTIGIKSATTATRLLQATNIIGWVTLAIGAVMAYNNVQEDVIEKANDLAKAQAEVAEQMAKFDRGTKELVDDFEKLVNEMNDATTSVEDADAIYRQIQNTYSGYLSKQELERKNLEDLNGEYTQLIDNIKQVREVKRLEAKKDFIISSYGLDAGELAELAVGLKMPVEELFDFQEKWIEQVSEKGFIGDKLYNELNSQLRNYIKTVLITAEEFDKISRKELDGYWDAEMINSYQGGVLYQAKTFGDLTEASVKWNNALINMAEALKDLHGEQQNVKTDLEWFKFTFAKDNDFNSLLETATNKTEEYIKTMRAYSYSKINISPSPDLDKSDIRRIQNDFLKEYSESQIDKIYEITTDVAGKDVDFLNKLGDVVVKFKRQTNETTNDWVKRLESERKTNQEKIDLRTRNGELNLTTDEEITKAKALNAIIDRLIGKEAKKDNAALERLKKQIQLVEQLGKDYEEMWKKYGKKYADEHIFSEERKASFAETGLNLTDFLVGDKQTIINNLKQLEPFAETLKGGMLELMKAQTGIQVDIDWEDKEDSNEKLARYFESLFGDYELTLELEKLNIPKDLASRIFGFDTVDLDDIRRKALNKAGLSALKDKTNEDIFNSAEFKRLDDAVQKQVSDTLKKVSEKEDKEQKERLKKYSKYLVQAQSERIKIKLDELRQREEIESLDIGDADKELMRQGVQKDIQKRLDTQTWKDFQKSGMYVRLFDNLEGASIHSLDKMENALMGLRDSLKDLDPSELKEINNQLEKIRNIKVDKNPFRGLADDAKTYFEYVKNRQDWETSLDASEVKEANLRSKADEQSLYIKSLEDEIDLIDQSTIEGENLAIVMAEKVELEKANLKVLLDELEAQGKITKEERERIEKGQDAGKSIQDRLRKTAQDISAVTSSMADMATNLEAAFGMSDRLKDTFELLQGIGGGVSGMFEGAAGLFSGNPLQMIQGGMQLVSGVSKIFASFNEAHDTRIERKIESEIKLVERLGKLYEKLEKQIEAAYSIDTFQAANDAAKENLEQQIRATERMIEAERDKKDTDHKRIEEWQEQIEENLEMLEELEAKRLQELGGIGGEDYYKDAAQGFVDAWLEAFYETGDGLTALEDEFDEVMKNLVKKQVLQRVAGALLEPLLTSIDTAVGNDGLFDEKEFAATMELVKQIFPDFNEKMKQTIEEMGMTDWAGKNAELGSLSAGIQGITSEQSDILASYLNSIRFYVADSNTQLKALVAAQGIDTDTPNPMLSQLLVIAEQTRAIRDLFDSVVVGGHKMGRSGIKVFID